METYYITGVQLGMILGMLQCDDGREEVFELIKEIMEKQQVSNQVRELK